MQVKIGLMKGVFWGFLGSESKVICRRERRGTGLGLIQREV